MREEHQYISTACHHELHDRCRKSCKFCAVACQCPCHGDRAPVVNPAQPDSGEWLERIDALKSEGLAEIAHGRSRHKWLEYVGALQESAPRLIAIAREHQGCAAFADKWAGNVGVALSAAIDHEEELEQQLAARRAIIRSLAEELCPDSPIESALAEFDLDGMGACQIVRRQRAIARASQLHVDLLQRFINYHDAVARGESVQEVQECVCLVCGDTRAAIATYKEATK